MRPSKSLKLALNIILHSKLRSWLTIIGIVIGIAAVVAIVSIGEGMQQNVESRLGGLGADIITISPGGGRASRGFMGGGGPPGAWGSTATTTSAKDLTKKDVQVLRTIDGIAFIHGTVSGSGEVYYLGEKATISITGVDPLVWKELTTSKLASGRFLGPSDYNVVIVGSRIAEHTFKQPLALNRQLTIEGKAFKIAGILAESGTGGDDNRIYMPLEAARTTLENVGDEAFDAITLKAASAEDVEQIMAEVEEKLLISRHLTESKKDFSISSTKAMQETITDVTQTMSLFLETIAAVSLLVGGVGIANTMFTSVLEKTKEIGIMKSIGAKNGDIMMIFLLNSALVGFTGGLLGICLGAAISSVLPLLGMRVMGMGGELTTAITPLLLLYAVLLAMGIGIAAGVIPAYRASKLKPVDALRYE